jgi:hypothetical protein
MPDLAGMSPDPGDPPDLGVLAISLALLLLWTWLSAPRECETNDYEHAWWAACAHAKLYTTGGTLLPAQAPRPHTTVAGLAALQRTKEETEPFYQDLPTALLDENAAQQQCAQTPRPHATAAGTAVSQRTKEETDQFNQDLPTALQGSTAAQHQHQQNAAQQQCAQAPRPHTTVAGLAAPQRPKEETELFYQDLPTALQGSTAAQHHWQHQLHAAQTPPPPLHAGTPRKRRHSGRHAMSLRTEPLSRHWRCMMFPPLA